jgi:hypothetical protein
MTLAQWLIAAWLIWGLFALWYVMFSDLARDLRAGRYEYHPRPRRQRKPRRRHRHDVWRALVEDLEREHRV